jgi:hypothetical protein
MPAIPERAKKYNRKKKKRKKNAKFYHIVVVMERTAKNEMHPVKILS